MRRLFVVSCVIFFGVAAVFTASAQTVSAEATANVAAMLVKFPAGGLALTNAIVAAVEADPALARAAAAAATSATAVQQQSIGSGLAAAAIFFGDAAAGGGAGAAAARRTQQEIQTATASAPALAQTAFATYSVALSNTASNGRGTDQCVSPSRGHGNCNNP